MSDIKSWREQLPEAIRRSQERDRLKAATADYSQLYFSRQEIALVQAAIIYATTGDNNEIPRILRFLLYDLDRKLKDHCGDLSPEQFEAVTEGRLNDL